MTHLMYHIVAVIEWFESRPWRGVLDAILCTKICSWLSHAIAMSYTSKMYNHNITDMFLKTCIMLNIR